MTSTLLGEARENGQHGPNREDRRQPQLSLQTALVRGNTSSHAMRPAKARVGEPF